MSVRKPGYFGILGQDEWANVSFRDRKFDDAALARLAAEHGDRITGLELENTSVTDAGLKSLGRFTRLRHLTLRNYLLRSRAGAPRPPPRITDAGMAHLKGLGQLWTLRLDDLPITDDGLAAIEGLPQLMGLYLGGTKVRGHGLARLKALPRLSILYLEDTPLDEEGLNNLSGATNLQILSLGRIPLTTDALPVFKTLPRLDRLGLSGCGLLDEEVDALVKSMPGLRVVRE